VVAHGPIVLVHGLAGSARWWRQTERALATDHPLHPIDLPGFGDLRGGRFTLGDAPAFVEEKLAEVGRAHLVGHSLGGLVCARVAARRADLVDRLVLVAPASSRPHRSLPGHALLLAAALRTASPSFLRLLVADSLRAGPRTVWRAGRQVMRADVLPDLHAIRSPTLLVWGERDPLVPPSVGMLFQAEIPNARLELVAGAKHVPMVERPNEFCRLLTEFLP
jgi:pimeloyl-ACP methyl ester carboxylesterase